MMTRYVVALAVGVCLSGWPSTAAAQVDIAGEWVSEFSEDRVERIPGPDVGDYAGLPLNDAARLKADTWQASVQTLPERQCIPHPSPYSLRGPTNLRISADVDPVTQETVSYTIYGTFGRATRLVWMDGRPRPSPLAPHTWAGFSTGRWEGSRLRIDTTHIKLGYLRRNGVPHSDLATMTEYLWVRGDRLQISSIVDDPVYLSEPLVRTTDFVRNPTQHGVATPCEPTDEVFGRPKGEVPHYLPGTNPYLTEFATRFGLPQAAARGGAETALPEFARGATRETPTPTPRPADAPRPGVPDVEELDVRAGIRLVAVDGQNVTVSAGADGLLVVDTGRDAGAARLAEAVGRMRQPVRAIVNTSAGADHTGGNALLASRGRRLGGAAAGASGFADITRDQPTAEIYAHEAVLNRVSTTGAAVGAWPTTTFSGDSKELFFNGEGIQVLHVPAAHSDGDAVVFFRRSDVICTGEIYDATSYPRIDVARGGSISGIVAGLNRVLELTIPASWQEGGTLVVPARGRVGDEADVVEYRDMLTIVRDRIAALIARGASLDEVQAARPTQDYDGRFGSVSGPWTTTMFVEAAYRSLARAR